MKNSLLSLTALLILTFTVSTKAQITLTQSDVPAIGDILFQAEADTTGVSPGMAGAGQTWDFSFLDTLSIDTTTYINPADAPNNEEFPTANLASSNGGSYFYQNSTPTALWGLGGTIYDPDTDSFFNLFFDPPSKQIVFPTTFGTTFSDSTNIDITLATPDGTFRVKSTLLSDNEIDAYGTVTTPVGSFEALRMATTTNNIDSVWIDLLGQWILISNEQTTEMTYTFISQESRGPLVSIDYSEDGSLSGVSYWLATTSVPQAPVAQFSVEDQGAGFLAFTDLSLNDPTSWLWDFGDGDSSTLQNPQHTYTDAGEYEVCLTVTNAQGSNTFCEMFTIVFAPVAAFTYVDQGIGVIGFEDQSTNIPTTWLWDFGNGNTSGEQNPTHSYTVNGNYNVCLTVTNEGGSDTACQMISVVVVGLNDEVASIKLKAFPNPAKDIFYLKLDNVPGTLYFKVMDVLGRAIYMNEIRNVLSVNVQDWPEGTYFYQVISKEGHLLASGKMAVVK